MGYVDMVASDIRQLIESEDIDLSCYESMDEALQELEDELFNDDSVTGNLSGSYNFNSTWAKGFVLANVEEVICAYSDFGYGDEDLGKDFSQHNWEKMDVLARCWALNQALYRVLDEIVEWPVAGGDSDE